MSTFHAVYDDERCLEPVAVVAEHHLATIDWLIWLMHAQQFATAIRNFDYAQN